MNLRHFCRKTAGFLLTAAILMGGTITAYAKPDWPSDVGILADSGILMDMDSGTVIFGQQIHSQYHKALNRPGGGRTCFFGRCSHIFP